MTASRALIVLSLFLVACSRSSSLPSSLPAEAEVQASSGPVKLVLSLYKTRVPLSDNGGFMQAHVYFRAGLTNVGREEIWARFDLLESPAEALGGMTLEVVDEKGRPQPRWPFFPEGRSMGAGDEIKGNPPPKKAEARGFLEPGGSLWTKTGVHQTSKAAPVDGYAEVPYVLEKKGAYKARLVYDLTFMREPGAAQAWKTRVVTPFIPFTVE